MKTYNPDRWVLVEIKSAEGTHRKILAGWSGSYLHGSSWKLSSGVEKIEKTNYGWRVHNASGSIYECYATAEGWNSIMSSVFASFEEQLKELGGTIEVVKIE